MELTLRFVFGLAVMLAAIGVVGWVLWRLLKNSTDPSALLFRWLATGAVIVGGYYAIDRLIGPNGGLIEKSLGVFAGMFFGLGRAA